MFIFIVINSYGIVFVVSLTNIIIQPILHKFIASQVAHLIISNDYWCNFNCWRWHAGIWSDHIEWL